MTTHNLQNKEGQPIPRMVFKIRDDNEWHLRSTNDIFSGKTVVVFSLPGAFTPTCSSTHLPRYEELADTLRENGVDEIVCVSVNDTFVMNAWGEEQGVENITLLPDGNGDFTRGMGMLVDKTELGFGERSWRYSMLVKNGMIEKMFIEPDVEGDPFEVSDADTMLAYINADAKAPEAVSLFTKVGCPFCAQAKDLLQGKGIKYEEITLGKDTSTTSLKAITGQDSVPQIYIGGKHIGGSEELEAYLS